jgi:hypothetical protein
MVNSEGLILHKTDHKNGRKYDNDIDIYKRNHPLTPKDLENIFDLGYLGVQNDFATVKLYFQLERKETDFF